MPLHRRVLDPSPALTLQDYTGQGGGLGLSEARRLGPESVIEEVSTAGLRGRGGAGFPVGTKWRTVAANGSASAPTTVIVNGAEGEPGTFKDRTLIRCNPYKVLEGALIAAVAVGAPEVIVCLKQSFAREVAGVRRAMEEVREADWAPEVRLRVVEGPSSYLFGEETALLEVVEGRQPFPRIDPPFRRGIDPQHLDSGHTASRVHLAAPGGTDAPPALVNNVETMANLPGILRHGSAWYRSIGTDASPGTVVCTVTGHTRRHAVGEVPMGTTVREAIHLIGGGPMPGSRVLAVLSGVANPILPASLLDTPMTFEDLAAVGSGLGAGGLIVFEEPTNLLAVARGVARFLSVESCGQCEPCKRDGLAIAGQLDELVQGRGTADVVRTLSGHLNTVARGARCSLASQQDLVIGSILRLVGPAQQLDDDGDDDPAALLAPVVDIADGWATLDTSQSSKQPDWTHARRDSGAWPAAYLGNRPLDIDPPRTPEDPRIGRMASVVTQVAVSEDSPGPDRSPS